MILDVPGIGEVDVELESMEYIHMCFHRLYSQPGSSPPFPVDAFTAGWIMAKAVDAAKKRDAANARPEGSPKEFSRNMLIEEAGR